MITLRVLAVVIAGAFAATSLHAEDHACCSSQASNGSKMSCPSYAHLKLTAEQRTKMDALAAECHKGGMDDAAIARMDKQAKQILSKDQYASWKSAHKDEKKSEKTQS